MNCVFFRNLCCKIDCFFSTAALWALLIICKKGCINLIDWLIDNHQRWQRRGGDGCWRSSTGCCHRRRLIIFQYFGESNCFNALIYLILLWSSRTHSKYLRVSTFCTCCPCNTRPIEAVGLRTNLTCSTTRNSKYQGRDFHLCIAKTRPNTVLNWHETGLFIVNQNIKSPRTWYIGIESVWRILVIK